MTEVNMHDEIFVDETTNFLNLLQDEGDLAAMIIKYVLLPCDHALQSESLGDEDDDDIDDDDDEILGQRAFILHNVFVTRFFLMIVTISKQKNLLDKIQSKHLSDYLLNSPWWKPVRNSGVAIDLLKSI